MPTAQYTALANITLGSSAASVTFSSISQAYRDLVLVYSSNGPAVNVFGRFNSDSGSNYPAVYMSGDGATASSSSYTSSNIFIGASGTDNPNSITNVMDYSATDKHKTVLTRTNKASSAVEAYAQRWASTSAITSITVYVGTTMSAGTTLALYGVK